MSFTYHPVTNVDWFQASAYAEWVGGRLPTEAEWEKACRGDELRRYPWGNAEPVANLVNFLDSDMGAIAPVGSYSAGASPYGALDMAGNVSEWVADWYDSDYYGQSPERNPTGPASGQTRVLRGGSFISNENLVRCAARFLNLPRARYDGRGFRVASPGG